MKRWQKGIWVVLLILLAACAREEEAATPNPDGLSEGELATQQAVIEILTRQAAEPRPTRLSAIQRQRTREALVAPTMTFMAQSVQEKEGDAAEGTAVAAGAPLPSRQSMTVPAGASVRLDGVLSPGEWGAAGVQRIPLESGRQVLVYFLHDEANFYFAFVGLDEEPVALFPEVMIDTGFDSIAAWNASDFWFHVSANQCQGQGAEALWQRCGVAEGWDSSTFSQNKSVIEIQIPYEQVGVTPGQEDPVAMAVAVLSLSVEGEEVRDFWPETAVLAQPATWIGAKPGSGW